MPQLHFAQLRYLSIIVLAWLAVFLLTRSVLLATHLADAQVSAGQLLSLYGVGLVYDLSFLLYASLPLSLYLLLCPRRLWQQRWHKRFLLTVVGVSLFVMLFTAVAEWLFWDEFGVRFNFIAVDYLVYSEEVINNILESYPIYPLLALLAIVAIASVSWRVMGRSSSLPRSVITSWITRSFTPRWPSLMWPACYAAKSVSPMRALSAAIRKIFAG